MPFDGAPSRSGPRGDRWMQAIVESPGPDAQLQFYVRGPRPDINDEWGPSSSRKEGKESSWPGSNGRGGGGRGGGGGGGAGEGVAEDRPSAGAGSNGGGGYYTLPWPSGWKLERGNVTKFLRALQGPIMLVGAGRLKGAAGLAGCLGLGVRFQGGDALRPLAPGQVIARWHGSLPVPMWRLLGR